MPLQAGQAPAAELSPEDEKREALEEQRCSKAFEAVQDFEQGHCLVVPSMSQPYLEVELLTYKECRHSCWLSMCSRFLGGSQAFQCRIFKPAGILACLLPWQADFRVWTEGALITRTFSVQAGSSCSWWSLQYTCCSAPPMQLWDTAAGQDPPGQESAALGKGLGRKA